MTKIRFAGFHWRLDTEAVVDGRLRPSFVVIPDEETFEETAEDMAYDSFGLSETAMEIWDEEADET